MLHIAFGAISLLDNHHHHHHLFALVKEQNIQITSQGNGEETLRNPHRKYGAA